MTASTKIDFEWDPSKAKTNLLKHGISFEQAATVFLDPNMLSIFDEDHSIDEDRWITIGLSQQGILLIVCHIFRESTQRILVRIFSARKASRKESMAYKEGSHEA